MQFIYTGLNNRQKPLLTKLNKVIMSYLFAVFCMTIDVFMEVNEWMSVSYSYNID